MTRSQSEDPTELELQILKVLGIGIPQPFGRCGKHWHWPEASWHTHPSSIL
jgi:hypothetical protein